MAILCAALFHVCHAANGTDNAEQRKYVSTACAACSVAYSIGTQGVVTMHL